MASRAIWKGQLRLSLVSIPVEIHSATKSGARISFNQIHGPSGQRVRYQKTVPGIGEIDTKDIVKGYDLGNDEYMLIEPADLEEIRLETKRTLELVQFVKKCEIPPLYYEKPYYVVPSDDLDQEAYRVVRDALRQSETVGIGQLTMRGREYLCSIEPCGDGLLMETLLYADEVAKADALFSDLVDETADPDLLDVARQLIDRKTAPFNAEAFKDHYDIALRELIDAKRSNRKTPRVHAGKSGPAPVNNVIDLMEALKASLKANGEKPKAVRKGRTKPQEAAVQKSLKSEDAALKSASRKATNSPKPRSPKTGSSKAT